MRALKILLEAFGIKVDPEEVEQFYERMKVELPGAIDSLKGSFQSIDNRLGLTDRSLDEMTALLCNMHARLSAIENHLTHDGTPSAEAKPNGRTDAKNSNHPSRN